MAEDSAPISHACWNELAQLAVRGLRATYLQPGVDLPHTVKWNGTNAAPSGVNVRYGLISILGLAKAWRLEFEENELISSLWERIVARRGVIEDSAGDLGLALWAQALIDRDTPFTTTQAWEVFQTTKDRLDSVHLAWLMLGSDHVLELNDDVAARKLNESAKSDLLKLWNPATNLMYRHARSGLLASVSGRVPCFANQIYPVMALAVHARRTGCPESARIGRGLAETLCRLQGPMGQWWWLYDAARGGVVDGYPVFSVHQDGMAPMALLETTRAGGRSFEVEIARGLRWISGTNELQSNLVLKPQGLVLRDIHKRGFGRVRRAMRSAAWTWSLRAVEQKQQSTRFTVNRECRPYHLGWILYAASLARAAQTDATDCSCTEAVIHAAR